MTWPGKVGSACGRSEAERTVTELEGLHGSKTGALFRASLKMGALAARANKESPSRELIERLDILAGASAWLSRSPTTCSMWRGTPIRPASACGRTPPAAS